MSLRGGGTQISKSLDLASLTPKPKLLHQPTGCRDGAWTQGFWGPEIKQGHTDWLPLRAKGPSWKTA